MHPRDTIQANGRIPLRQDPNAKINPSARRRGKKVYLCCTNGLHDEHNCPLQLVFRSDRPRTDGGKGKEVDGGEALDSGEGIAKEDGGDVKRQRSAATSVMWYLDHNASCFSHAAACRLIYDQDTTERLIDRKNPITSRHNKEGLVCVM